MNWLTKAGLGLAVLAGIFISGAVVGYRYRKPEIQTKTQVVEKEHIVTKVVTVTEKAPDGTATTTTTTSTTSDTTTATDSKHPAQPVAWGQSPVRPAEYSVGLDWTPRSDPRAYYPTGLELGRRIYGPVWGTVGHDWHTHSTTVGVRVEF